MAVHATCEANIVKLRDELRQLENEYDDSVYDRWILEHQYRMAVARMQEHDPDGIAWLDEQVRRWESRREGYLEDRRRLRLGGRKARHLSRVKAAPLAFADGETGVKARRSVSDADHSPGQVEPSIRRPMASAISRPRLSDALR